MSDFTPVDAESARMLRAIFDECERGTEKHGDFASLHEGYAVIKEEFDELWDEIKERDYSLERLEEEATQVAAMAFKFLHLLRRIRRDLMGE